MKKNSLAKQGLSLSQAQSISNLCNQRAIDITSQISECNNSGKSLKIAGEKYIETQPKPLPQNVIELLKEKSKLRATQAFLMENIKAKDQMIRDLQLKRFMITGENKPEFPKFKEAELGIQVDELWGWNQLSLEEFNEYLEAEAFAAHIGQFIHKGGQLDRLRTELPRIKTLEWMEVKAGEKTPMTVTIHHKAEDLLKLHEELAALHRNYEQKVNFFKAKVKNLVTKENARIAKDNADVQSEVNVHNNNLRAEYDTLTAKWHDAQKVLIQEFEQKRQHEIKEAAELRIQVDPRFQSIIDIFLKQLE